MASKFPVNSPEYTFQSPRRQAFSLPGSFMQYLSQNGAVYEKLIKSCKYFFARYQLIPMEKLIIRKSKIEGNPVKSFWIYDEINFHLLRDQFIIDLKKSKLWIYDCIECWDKNFPNLFFSFLKSVYRCTPTSLGLWFQNLEVKDFVKISTNIKKVEIDNIKFLYSDKTEASFWDILARMPKLETYLTSENHYVHPFILSTNKTSIPVLSSLKDFYFSDLPIADFHVFAEFIKLHPNTEFKLVIEEYIEQIDVEAFKIILKDTFPGSSITQQEYDEKIEFEWTSESQYVQVRLR